MDQNMSNIYSLISSNHDQEAFETLLENDHFHLEKIQSEGHATPEGEWLDQSEDEWVVLLRGSAGLMLEGEPQEVVLNSGDYLLIPAHTKHRVEWTSATEKTFWLALHYKSR